MVFVATFSLIFPCFLYTSHMKYNFFDTEQVEHLNLSFWQSPAWYRLLSESHQAKEVFYFGDPSATFLLIEIRRI